MKRGQRTSKQKVPQARTPKGSNGHKTPGSSKRSGTGKTSLTQNELAQIKQEISERFFQSPSTEETEVVLMVVDPYCAYAYWSIGNQDWAHTRKQLKARKPAQLILRFYELTDKKFPMPPCFDVKVHGKTNNWYVDLWADNKCYFVELGLAKPGGQFVALARSNTVETPRAGPVNPLAPVIFVRHDTQPPLPVKTFPLEFSISIEERAARTQRLIARYFPTAAKVTPTQAESETDPPPESELTSKWSASPPKRKP